MTPHQQMAYRGVQRIVALLHHQDPSMKDADIAKLVSEAVHDYFDGLRSFTELVEYTEELGLYSDQETPKEE